MKANNLLNLLSSIQIEEKESNVQVKLKNDGINFLTGIYTKYKLALDDYKKSPNVNKLEIPMNYLSKLYDDIADGKNYNYYLVGSFPYNVWDQLNELDNTLFTLVLKIKNREPKSDIDSLLQDFESNLESQMDRLDKYKDNIFIESDDQKTKFRNMIAVYNANISNLHNKMSKIKDSMSKSGFSVQMQKQYNNLKTKVENVKKAILNLRIKLKTL